mgnify:CR=1 FL=1
MSLLLLAAIRALIGSIPTLLMLNFQDESVMYFAFVSNENDSRLYNCSYLAVIRLRITEFLLASFCRASLCHAFGKTPKKAPCGAISRKSHDVCVQLGSSMMSDSEIACLNLNH